MRKYIILIVLLLVFIIPVQAYRSSVWYAIDSSFAESLVGSFSDMGEDVPVTFTGYSTHDIRYGSYAFSLVMRDFEFSNTIVNDQSLNANIYDSFSRYALTTESSVFVDGFNSIFVCCYTASSPFDAIDAPVYMPTAQIHRLGTPLSLRSVSSTPLDVTFIGAQYTQSDGFYTVYLIYNFSYNVIVNVDEGYDPPLEIYSNSYISIDITGRPYTSDESGISYSYGLSSESAFFNEIPAETLPPVTDIDPIDPWDSIVAPDTSGIVIDGDNASIWSTIYGLDLIKYIWIPIMVSGIGLFLFKVMIWKDV